MRFFIPFVFLIVSVYSCKLQSFKNEVEVGFGKKFKNNPGIEIKGCYELHWSLSFN